MVHRTWCMVIVKARRQFVLRPWISYNRRFASHLPYPSPINQIRTGKILFGSIFRNSNSELEILVVNSESLWRPIRIEAHVRFLFLSHIFASKYDFRNRNMIFSTKKWISKQKCNFQNKNMIVSRKNSDLPNKTIIFLIEIKSSLMKYSPLLLIWYIHMHASVAILAQTVCSGVYVCQSCKKPNPNLIPNW